MPELNWSVSIQVSGGPNMTIFAPSEQVEAIDRIEVNVQSGGDTTIDLQPGLVGQIRLLVIESSTYADELTFVLVDGASTWPGPRKAVPLSHGPQIYSTSTGALLDVDPKQLKVTNKTGAAVTISILVARRATLGPP